MTGGPLPPNGGINSVAINASGEGLLGGQDFSGPAPAVAFTVTPAGVARAVTGGPLPPWQHQSVAINASGEGLLGGGDFSGSQPAVAFTVTPSGVAKAVTGTPLPTHGYIQSVAINDFNAGILGGRDFNSRAAVAYLVTPQGRAIALAGLPSNGYIYSVAILNLIPTSSLSGNNLKLANYINNNAPYLSYYFVPAYFDGTLASALESVAPTRNAFALFSADNNLFFLNSSFSNHSQSMRSQRRYTPTPSSSVAQGWTKRSDELLASASQKISGIKKKESPSENRPYTVWGEVLGALAYQKAQHQTPAFNPTTGAMILGFDAKATTHAYFGGGAAYAYTYIHEKKDAGHSHINQEYLFAYALWDNTKLYFDVALWGGLFQTENVRKVHMTAFEFQSKSHPKGWQIAPHFELGYDIDTCESYAMSRL